MKIFFHSAYWGYRGTEVALYDYAHHAEKLLGAESVILVAREKASRGGAVGDRFRRRFQVLEYNTWKDAQTILQQHQADLFYTIKNGFFDGVVPEKTKTAVHTIFPESDFHGDRYAYLSAWLARTMTGRSEPWVPFMVDLPPPQTGLRANLGIPESAVVLGRHGGADSFDIPFVKKEVLRAVGQRQNLWFLFLGTEPFVLPRGTERVVFLPATVDPVQKSSFLHACDGMIHARHRGETFGLAVAEFAWLGKPVITWELSPESFHLEALGTGHPRYRDARSLRRILDQFEKPAAPVTSLYREICEPGFAMERFQRHFLDG